MAVRDDRVEVKQTTAGFRGPLMEQLRTSAKSKFLSLMCMVEGLEKNLFMSAALCVGLGFSSSCLSNEFGNKSADLFLTGCYTSMPKIQCDLEFDKKNKRAYNYFKHFLLLSGVKYGLESTGYLPTVKRGVRVIDELRTYDASFGTLYYNGDGFEVKDLFGVKNSYLDVSLKFKHKRVDGFKIQYSVRF